MAHLSTEELRRYDLSWAAHAVKRNCPADEVQDWFDYRYTSRLHAYLDKILPVWHYANGQPHVVEALRVIDIDLSFDRGLRVHTKRQKGELFIVTGTPSKLPGLDVFVWTPALSELRYAPSQWDNPAAPRQLRFAINFKQKRNPLDGPEQGEHYLSELAGFRKMWPAFADIRL